MNCKTLIIPLLALIVPLASCGRKKDVKTLPNLPEEVRPVAEAIVNDSPSSFAAVVSYPIERPYPLRNVADSAEMTRYYSTLVDASLRKCVEEAPDSAWRQEGWRGWTLADGSFFWIDNGKIYEMPYVSQHENIMLDSLQNAELSTLKSSLRSGWTPVACVTDTVSGAIFRIDSQEATNPPVYRLAGYAAGADLSGEPTLILYGTLDLEGSMGNRFYTFEGDDGTTALYSPDAAEDDKCPEIEIDRKGKAKRYSAKPDYWLDHVRRAHSKR